MIKLKDLLFEQTKVENLPVVEFADNFQNNYITVTGNWKVNADLAVKQINDELAKGKKLEDLTIKINGGATDISATNGYKGTNPPNHNFETVGVTTGGLLPGGKWNPDYDKRKNVPGGNNWLANERAEALKALLIPYISRALKTKFDNVEVTADKVTSTSTKSAYAVVTSAVKPRQTNIAKYVIQYRWYTVGNDKNMVLVDAPNNIAGFRNIRNTMMDTKWYNAAMADKNIIYSGFQKGRGVTPYAFTKLNASSYSKTFAIYNDEASWLADVKKMTQYATDSPKQLFLTTPGEKPGQILPGYRGAEGYLDRSGKGKYYGYAEFQLRSKDVSVNSNLPYYLFKPQGDTLKYVVDLFTAPNQFKAPQTAAKNSNGEKSMLIGREYDVEKSGTKAIAYTGETTIKPYS